MNNNKIKDNWEQLISDTHKYCNKPTNDNPEHIYALRLKLFLEENGVRKLRILQ